MSTLRWKAWAPLLIVVLGPLAAAAQPARNVPPHLFKDVPYVPTPQPAVEHMLRMAGAGPQDVVFDLGSGDGRIVVTAVQKFGVRRAVGVDIDPQRIAESLENARRAGVSDRTEFQQKDLRDADFRAATVLTMYLLPNINMMLKPRLLTELKPGTRVVSHQFTLGDWAPDEQAEVEGRMLYRWTVPAKVDGAWQWTVDGESFRLQLGQQYQVIGGTLRAFGASAPLGQTRLTGDRLSFRTALLRDGAETPVSFDGRVAGGTLSGVLQLGERRTEIAARRAD